MASKRFSPEPTLDYHNLVLWLTFKEKSETADIINLYFILNVLTYISFLERKLSQSVRHWFFTDFVFFSCKIKV